METFSQEAGGRRALLIGINEYPLLPGRSLKGCVRDAELLSALLRERFDFPDRNITLLRNDEATRDGILAAWDRLTEETQEGDVVVVFYAGHGSQMTDREGDEPDGLDETLVPFDSGRNPHPNRDITDDEIYLRILALSSRTAHIALIFDCCHSGTIVRDAFGTAVRQIPTDDRPVDQLPPSPVDERLPRLRDTGAPSWAPVGSRYVLLAACRSDELASEHRVEPDLTHGAFTWFLARELTGARAGSTYREVFERVGAQLTAAFPRQHPQMEGTRDREVFGRLDREPPRFVPVLRRAGDRVWLGGGAVLGLRAGAMWRVYPQGERSAEEASALGWVRLVSVGANSSEAVVVEEERPGAIEVLARAVEEMPAPDSFRLAVEAALDGELAELEARLDRSPLLRRASPEHPAAVRVYRIAPRTRVREEDPVPQLGALGVTTWAAVGEDGRLALPLCPEGPAAVDEVISGLETVARFRHVLRLENPDLGDPLRGRIDLILERRIEGEDWTILGSPAVVTEEDFLAFTVVNRSTFSVSIGVLDLGLAAAVSLIFPPPGATEPLRPGSSVTFGKRPGEELQAFVPNGFPFAVDPTDSAPAAGTEHLKVFASTQPIDLTLLEQRGLLPSRRPPTRDLRPRRAEPWTTVMRSFLLVSRGEG